MLVYVSKFVLDKQYLENIAIPVTKRSMIVTCSSEYKQFGKSRRDLTLHSFIQAFNLDGLCTIPMTLSCSHIIPVQFAENPDHPARFIPIDEYQGRITP